MSNTQTIPCIAPAVKYRPNSKRYCFDVARGSVLLSVRNVFELAAEYGIRFGH